MRRLVDLPNVSFAKNNASHCGTWLIFAGNRNRSENGANAGRDAGNRKKGGKTSQKMVRTQEETQGIETGQKMVRKPEETQKTSQKIVRTPRKMGRRTGNGAKQVRK